MLKPKELVRVPKVKRIETYLGTTDANGLITVTYPHPVYDRTERSTRTGAEFRHGVGQGIQYGKRIQHSTRTARCSHGAHDSSVGGHCYERSGYDYSGVGG